MKIAVLMSALSVMGISDIALAGGGPSKMQSGPMGGGCTYVRVPSFGHPGMPTFGGGGSGNTTIFIGNNSEPPRQEPQPTPQQPQGPSQSEIKGNELRGYYTTFNAIQGRPDDSTIESFVLNTTRILIGWSEHNPIAKRRWSAENRTVYKILFGSICYIGNPSDTEIRDWLTGEGLTQQDFADLDQLRHGAGVHRMATSCLMMSGGDLGASTNDPMRSVVKRFVDRF